MSLLELTVQPDPDVTHLETAVVLELARYRFAFYTCVDTDGWTLDVTSDDGTSAVKGIAIVCGVDILHPYRALDVPPGQLFCHSADDVDPDLTAFSEGRAALYYLEAQ